jgi:hypothetical protein
MSKSKTDFERVTLYTRNKEEFQRAIKRLELENFVVEEAERREIHEAILKEARENPDGWIQHLSS